MEAGWINRVTGLGWSTRPPLPGVPTEGIWPIPWKGTVLMRSYLCRGCKVLTIDYENILKELRLPGSTLDTPSER
jgi:hypothetical protein